jgi:TPR repeat protein
MSIAPGGAALAGLLALLATSSCQRSEEPKADPLPRGAPAELRIRCEQGVAAACNDLGFLYFEGRGLAKDAWKAKDFYGLACQGGDALGCLNLALMYLNGEGIPKDAGLAAGLFQRACERGEVAACANLGLLYQSGRGVPRDESRAAALLRAACDRGFGEACQALPPARPR